MRPGEVDAAGPPDVDDLRSSDELLDRLGRREPGADDLDDPLIATLAVLAGDVDLLPVPVSASRRALADVGGWPPPVGRDEAPGARRPPAAVPRPPGTAVPRPASRPASAVPPVCGTGPLPAPVAVPVAGPSAEGPARRRRPPERLVPALDHPRVLRLRPAIGMAAAAVLAVLGGGIAVSVALLGPERGERVQTVGGLWADQSPAGMTRAALSRRLQEAEEALRSGDRAVARAILAEVVARLRALPAEELPALSARAEALQRALAEDPASGTSQDGAAVPVSTSVPGSASASASGPASGSASGSGSAVRDGGGRPAGSGQVRSRARRPAAVTGPTASTASAAGDAAPGSGSGRTASGTASGGAAGTSCSSGTTSAAEGDDDHAASSATGHGTRDCVRTDGDADQGTSRSGHDHSGHDRSDGDRSDRDHSGRDGSGGDRTPRSRAQWVSEEG